MDLTRTMSVACLNTWQCYSEVLRTCSDFFAEHQKVVQRIGEIVQVLVTVSAETINLPVFATLLI